MTYRKEIKITQNLSDEINHLLTKFNEDFGEDLAIIKTAIFDNGFEMDIKCCGRRDDVAWTEAVLFRNGSEVCCTEPCDEFLGEWECTNDTDTYIVNVVVESKDDTMPRIKLWDIDWDTDYEDVDLPTEVIIDSPTDEMCEAVGGFDDVLADYLSDKYGWCVFGFYADFC